MSYSATKFQLTHLLQKAWYRMGQIRRWKATDGDATQLINTNWAGVEEPIYEDDDPALIYGTVVAIKTTDGLAPEGEMGMITDYDSSIQKITMETLSAIISAGDIVGIASPLFPLEDMIELANSALTKLGEIDQPDYVNVTQNTVFYNLPSTIRQEPTLIRYLSPITTTLPRIVSNWRVMPDAAGTNLVLSLPLGDYENGGQFEIFYSAQHAKLTAFDSDISEFINPELLICSLVAEAYQWYNNQVGGSNQYFLQRENKALQDLESALVKYPIRRLTGQISGFPHWGRSGEYVPLTSDLRS